MANLEHWNSFNTKLEMWRLLVGHDEDDPEETLAQAHKIFGGITGTACLEIGAGVGRLLHWARRHFEIAVGVEWSWRMLEEREGCPGTLIVHNDGFRLPFGKETFNFVYSFTCFQHMETPEMIVSNIREAHRVLCKGGSIVVQTVMGENGTGKHDGYVFNSMEVFLKEFFDAGFSEGGAQVEDQWIWVRAKK